MRKTERAQSLVEMAIIVLLLTGLLTLIVDLGRLLFSYVAIQSAAEEGAIYGSMNSYNAGPNPWATAVAARVRTSSNSLANLSNATVSTSFPGGTHCEGDVVQVTVTITFQPIMPGWSAFNISHIAKNVILNSSC